MRVFALLVLLLALTACGGSNSASPPVATPKATATPGKIPIVGSGPIPKMTAIGGNRPLPTANPHATPGRLPTIPPKPTPTPFPASAFNVTISGTVRASAGAMPIAGARVTVGSNLRRATTNTNGRYHVQFPAGAPVLVSVSAAGYSGAVALGKVQSHTSIRLDFKLDARHAGKSGLPSPPTLFGQP